MEFVDLGAKVHKCSLINELMNMFCSIGLCPLTNDTHSLLVSNNQVYSNDELTSSLFTHLDERFGPHGPLVLSSNII